MFLKCVAELKREGLESTVNWKPERHLGINIQYGTNGQVTLKQESNTLQFISSLGMTGAKPYFTPMEPMSLAQEESRSEEDLELDPRVTLYQSCIGQAIWILQTRFDIMCPAMSKPTVWHFKLLARLIRYLINNTKRGLIYRRGLPAEAFQMYADTDGALNLKAITGHALFFGKPDFVNHINKS